MRVTRWPRACWRLLRVLLHLLRGLALMRWRFAHLSKDARQAQIAGWSSGLLRVLGIRASVHGEVQVGAGLMVANHVSWLDITVLHSVCPRARFVSKADVQRWPLLGWMIGQAGTLFIQRERKRDAMRVVHEMAGAIQAGDLVAVFPEGTTGPGMPLLPFHGNLLQAAIAVHAEIQPVALRFSEPGQAFSWAAQYIGETSLLESLWRIACAKGLQVHVVVLAPEHAGGWERRALAEHLRQRIGADVSAPQAVSAT